MKKTFLLLFISFALFSCFSEDEKPVASKTGRSISTLNAEELPDYNHLNSVLISTGFKVIPRPVNYLDPSGFDTYKEVGFYSNLSDPKDVWVLYGWNADSLPGSEVNPVVANCSKYFLESYNSNGTITISCGGTGTTCDLLLANSPDGTINVTIIKCKVD